MEWTEEQNKAITESGRSILVSAAAGSGKTAVLIERIKRLMIEEGTDIDRFLITTFTNAAAAEMRERLDEALRKEMKKPGADRAMLTRQLSKLPSASIGTFHSFAFDVIRQYFYLIDIEPGFGVADEVQMSIMKQQAVDNVFARRYEEDTDEFRQFVLHYGAGKTDRDLRENVLETCRTLSSIHNGIEWARGKAALLVADHPVDAIGGYPYYARFIVDQLEKAREQYEEAAEMCYDEEYMNSYGVAAEDVQKLEEVIEDAKRAFHCPESKLQAAIEAFGPEIAAFKTGQMKWKADNTEKEVQDKISNKRTSAKQQINIILNTVYGRTFGEVEDELRAIYDDTMYYIGLLEEYCEELKGLKASENIIEFDDALHYAIDILHHEEAAAELRERYEYIFVDEYQDSNYLQEEIIKCIARTDNLYMVGDIKQCIYKFRLAEPEIFESRAEKYRELEDAADDDGVVLHIRDNFRSKRNVTDAVNCVFDQVMDGYDEHARLHCTAGEEHVGFPPRIHLIVNENFDEEAPEKNDAEGAVVAGIIRERLGSMVYDTKKEIMRPLQLRDFAVIVRNNREVEDIERYLINEGIDAYGESGGKYFETVEVQVFLNLLRIIENMRQDVPLISAMRSVVFGFTVHELAAIRIAHRYGSFAEAVFAYAEAEKDVDAHLQEKVRGMIRTVDVWKEISRTVPLEDLMKEILYNTGYYDYCSGLPVGTQRVSNLRLIADKAARFESMSSSGLYGFLRYVDSMENSDKTDSEAKVISEGENVVRVMSVHKSKGLEFPVVIFANASKNTEKQDRSGLIKIHRDYGIGLPVVNREKHWYRESLVQKEILMAARDEAVEEEIRILYVALTRAKDGLEIVGTIKNLDQLAKGPTKKKFLLMLYKPLTEGPAVGDAVFEPAEVLIYDDAEALAQSHSRRLHTPKQLLELAGHFEDPQLAELARKRLSYTYPHSSGAEIRPKYSVSELNRAAHEKDPIRIEPFDPDRARRMGGPLSAAEKGTVMHLLMEKADFAEAASFAGGAGAYLQTLADRLLADEIITAEEYDSLTIDKAAAFFDTEIGQRAAAAAAKGKLRKEKEFIFTMDMSEGKDPDAESIVQGVVDCFFEEDGGIILVDYKNSYMGAGRSVSDIRDTYAAQIGLYSSALEGATGKPVREAYLYLFDTGEFVSMK